MTCGCQTTQAEVSNGEPRTRYWCPDCGHKWEHHTPKMTYPNSGGCQWNGPFGEGHPGSKLTDDQAREIYRLAHTTDLSASDIAERYPISKSLVHKIKTESRWRHVTKEVNLDEEEPVLV